jgi:hypothetical protein
VTAWEYAPVALNDGIARVGVRSTCTTSIYASADTVQTCIITDLAQINFQKITREESAGSSLQFNLFQRNRWNAGTCFNYSSFQKKNFWGEKEAEKHPACDLLSWKVSRRTT